MKRQAMKYMIGRRGAWLLMTVLMAALSVCQLWAQRGVWHSALGMTSSAISALGEDSEGFVWVGTEFGLNRYDGQRYSTFLHDDDDSTSLSDNFVTALYKDPENRLWVGTAHGLCRYVPEKQNFVRVRFDMPYQPHVMQLQRDPDGTLCCATSGYGVWRVMGDSAVRMRRNMNELEDDFYQSVAFDRRGRFWKADQHGVVTCQHGRKMSESREVARCESHLGDVVAIVPHTTDTIYIVCKHGLMCYEGKGFRTLAVTRGQTELTQALHLDDGRLLLGTLTQGVWSYSGAKSALEPLHYAAYNSDPSTASISALMLDSYGNVWAGCYQSGLLLMPLKQQPYRAWTLSQEQRLSGSQLTSVVDINGQELLMTLSGRGLYQLKTGERSKACPGMQFATCVSYDAWGHCWVATDEGIHSFDPTTGKSKLVLPLTDPNVNCMTSDYQGRLYISMYGKGLCIYDPATGHSRLLNMFQPIAEDVSNRLCNDWIQHIIIDSQGNVWIATASGVCCYNPTLDSFSASGWSVLLNGCHCQCLAENSAGDILVGTQEGVYVYNVRKQKVTDSPLEGLAPLSRSVRSMVAMSDGTVWMGTSHGIWLYEPSEDRLAPFALFEGSELLEYNPGVSLLAVDDWVILGCYDGVICFDPVSLRTQQADPPALTLTAFMLDGEEVKPGWQSGGEAVYDGDITLTHDFTLSADNNSFTMAFSELSSDVMVVRQMQYSLDGRHWNNVVGKERELTFNHMPVGRYVIHVRVADRDSTSAVSVYRVTVRPPWYRTWWAWMIYGLLVLGFIGLCLGIWYRHKRNQMEDEKIQLLIDTTHDLRTPLTLILSPLHQLSEKHKADADSMRKLQTIDHNARRVLDLINKILDMRREKKPEPIPEEEPTQALTLTEEPPAPSRQPSRGQRILLVDEDNEITDYITRELSNRYRCHACSNGLEALQLLLNDPKRYDVVVSALMMKEMDGMTLLRSIKSNSQVSHVPVVLLTTQSEISSRLEALNAGADAYLTKPFVVDELRATLDSLISNSQRQRSKFEGKVEAAKASQSGEIELPQGLVVETDTRLLERVVKAVNQHLSEPDYGVDELCAEVGISRSQLHRKMKELTGVGAGEFVRNIRLEQAARLLRETDLNVSQVAYAVSFSNMGHFSKIFRQHFGVYPSEYGAEKPEQAPES